MNEKEVNELLNRIYLHIADVLPEFEFHLNRNAWVSSNTLKVDGSEGSNLKKVYVFEDNPFCIKDFRADEAVEIPTYLVNSEYHPDIIDRDSALDYIASFVGKKPLIKKDNKKKTVVVKQVGELLAQQSEYTQNIEPALSAYFAAKKSFRGVPEAQFRYFGFGSTVPLHGDDAELLLKVPLTFPLYSSEKVILSWLTYTHNSSYRYIFPKGAKPLILFLRRDLRPKGGDFSLPSDEIILTEGIFDCLTAWVHGFTCVAAIGGCSLSSHQLYILKASKIKKVTLILDNDIAGKNGAIKISRILKENDINVTIVTLPKHPKADKNDLDLFLRTSGGVALKEILENCPAPSEPNKNVIKYTSELFVDINYSQFEAMQRRDTRTLRTNVSIDNNEIGYQIGTITTVVGKTGHGKTTFLLNQSLEALSRGHKVAFISFEEGAEDLYIKMFTIFLGRIIDNSLPKSKNYSILKEDVLKILDYPNEGLCEPDIQLINKKHVDKYFIYIFNNPKHRHFILVRTLYQIFYEQFVKSGLLWIYYDPERTSGRLVDKVNKLYKEKSGFDLMVLDYIQLMVYDDTTPVYIGIKNILLDLKKTAIVNEFAICMGAQYNREVNTYDQINLSKIGESSEIGKTSHCVLGLWNSTVEENTNQVGKPLNWPTNVSFEVRVLKSRDGVTGTCYFSHTKSYNVLTPVKNYSYEMPTVTYKNDDNNDEDVPF